MKLSKIVNLFKRLFKRKQKNDVSPKEREDLIKAMNALKTEPCKPFVPVHHMPHSKLYKPRNAYQKRLWKNDKPLPKHINDEGDEE